MKEADGVGYDPKEDQAISPGLYRAHCSKFEAGQSKDKASHVYNLSFKIAKESAKLKIPRVETAESGKMTIFEDEMISAKSLVGRVIRGQGIWYTPNPQKGDSWRNREYIQDVATFGIEFSQDAEGRILLAQLEDDDVIGKPVLINIAEIEYQSRSKETRYTVNVVSIEPWPEGKVLTAEQLNEDDLPF